MSTGKLITLEGPEGGGKTTVCARLKAFYSNREIVLVREPGSTPMGEKIRTILQNEEMPDRAELLLFEAARACIVDTVIKPALEAGKDVLCDRFFDSTMAYQGFGRGLSTMEIDNLNAFAADDLVPNLTILLDVPCDVGMTRRGKPTDRIEAAGNEFHRRVRDGFLYIARMNRDRFEILDATKSADEVFADICDVIEAKLGWKKP